MVRGEVAIESAGGDSDGGLGTDEPSVRAAIERARGAAGAAVLCDLGSTVLTVRALLAELGEDRLALADAPLVEGAVAAAVTAAGDGTLEDVLLAAEGARSASKL